MLTQSCRGAVPLDCAKRAPLTSHIRLVRAKNPHPLSWSTPRPRSRLRCVAEATVEDFTVDEEELVSLENVQEKRPWWQSRHDSQIFRFAIPALMSNLIIPLSNTVDAAVVGRLGSAQFAGVGVGTTMTLVLSSCFSFIAVLITPFVARRLAEGKKEQVSSYVADSLWFGLIVGGIATLLVLSNANAIIEMLGPSIEIRPYALAYLRVSALMLPGAFWNPCFIGVFRGLKDSVTVLKCSFLAAIVNAVLDVVFVFGFGWSVPGAALATVFSLYCSGGVMLLKLISDGILTKKALLSLRNLLLLGMIATASILLSQSGMIVSATFEICRQTTLVTFISYWTFEQTIQALGASCLGRKDKKAAREMINRVMQLSLGMTLVIVSLMITFSQNFAGLFTSNPLVIARFVKIAPIVLASTPLSAVIGVAEGALIGAGKVRLTSSVQSVASALGLTALFTLHACSQLNVLTAWLVMRTGVILSGFVTAPYLLSTKFSPYGYQVLP